MQVSSFQSVYPFTQELLEEYPLMPDKKVDVILDKAQEVFQIWKKTNFSEKERLLKNVARILRRDIDVLSALITREMGKIISESKAEIEKCAVTADYYADHAESFLRDENLISDYDQSFVTYQPLGVILGIMPWNFPFWQVFRYVAPTIMAGNATLLKHAPNVCGCALALEKVFLEAGAPPGLFTTLIVDVPMVEKILGSSQVRAVTLTGSERAGSSVAALAGKHIKKSVMELGGSDALIVLADADIEKAVSVAFQSRMLNAGQSCIGAKRFIVVSSIADEFQHEMISRIQNTRQGDPFINETAVGPMARLDLVNALDKQMKSSVSMGASLLEGGGIEGCNFKPAVLVNVKKGMAAFDEETFGPLAAICIASDEQDAIRLANDSRYGLAGSIWTRDIDKGTRFARQIESGAVYINTLVKSDARLPFGGIKKSGYGRELGRHGILEFVNVKTIVADK